MKDIYNHLVHLTTPTIQNQSTIILLFFSFGINLLHSDVRFNMEEKICCYFHLIVTLS